MRARVFCVAAVVWLCACLPARGEFYEFTLQGQVTQASFWPNVAVGDPFTIKYVADDTDTNPDATFGRYNASDAVVTLPNRTITSAGIGTANVRLNLSNGTDVAGFASNAALYTFAIQFTFPAGTLASDALPLALQTSTPPAFLAINDVSSILRGDITSYSSAPVPEPHAAAGLLVTGMAAMRRFRRDTPLSANFA